MITVTATAFHEKLHIEEEEITLNGPPEFLAGNIFISNKNEETVFIRELPLVQASKNKNWPNMPASFKLITSLRPGEEKTQRITLRAPRHTAPGIYECTMNVGGKQKKIKIVVQPTIEIDIHPLDIHFQGVVPGKTYSTQVSFTNSGNLPFQIPTTIKHTNMLDEDYLCRATSMAIRQKGGDGFTAMMDELTKNIHSQMADWAIIKLEESGMIVQPGEAIQLHFSLELPKNADPTRDYFGNTRLWNKLLSYHINAYEDTSPETKKYGK
jgi:hypothetical protein